VVLHDEPRPVVLVRESHLDAVAGAVAEHVGERLLGGAVERQAGLGGQLARRARDDQARLPGGGVDELLEALRPRQLVAAQGGDGVARLGQPVGGQPVGVLDGVDDLGIRVTVARQQAGALELQREGGERVGEHVVHVARDAPALGQRHRLRVRGARLAQLVDQLLGLLPALGQPHDEPHDEEPGDDRDGDGDDGLRRALGAEAGGDRDADHREGAHGERGAQLEAQRGDDDHVVHDAVRDAGRLQRDQQARRDADDEQSGEPGGGGPPVARDAQGDPRHEGDDADGHQRAVAAQPRLRLGEERGDDDRRHHGHTEDVQGRRARGWLQQPHLPQR
jgi:hypothetical protein